MANKRKRPSMTMIAAAAIMGLPQLDRAGRVIVDGMGRPVPRFTIDEVRDMTPAQFVSLFQMDHAIYHTWDGPHAFWNYTPTLILEHRAKSKRDRKIIAKVARAEKRRTAEEQIEVFNDLDELNSKLDRMPKKRPDTRKPKAKRKWPKRTFKQQREWRTERASASAR